MCVPLICPDLHNQRTVEVARKVRVFDELYLAGFCNEDREGGKKGDILVGNRLLPFVYDWETLNLEIKMNLLL